MNKISLKTSYEVAVKLSVKKAEEARIQNLELVDYFSAYYLRTLTLKQINDFKKRPERFKRSNIVLIKSDLLPVDFLYMNRTLPIGEKPIVIKEEAEKELFKLITIKDEKLKEYSELFAEIQEALIQLSTFAKIQKEFPEAFEIIEKMENNSVAVNIKELRTKI